jgi:hypothetical protein
LSRTQKTPSAPIVEPPTSIVASSRFAVNFQALPIRWPSATRTRPASASASRSGATEDFTRRAGCERSSPFNTARAIAVTLTAERLSSTFVHVDSRRMSETICSMPSAERTIRRR